MNNLNERLKDLKSNQNTLKSNETDTQNKERKEIILNTAINMVSETLLKGEYVVPPVDIPTEFLSPIFNSDIVLFNIYLSQLTYKLDLEVKFEDNSNGENNAKTFLLRLLPEGSTVMKILTYNCGDVVSRATSWGGFIFEYNNCSFIALRGTSYSCEGYEDGKVLLTNPSWLSKDCKVHTGFNNIYTTESSKRKSLRIQIIQYLLDSYNLRNLDTSRLFITGHSLGGGLSYLLYADIAQNFPFLKDKTKVIGIAAPYPGNKSFVNIIMNNIFRKYTGVFSLINTKDLVPTAYSPGYSRFSYQLYCFINPKLNTLESHSIDNYRIELEDKNKQKLLDENTSNYMGSCGPIVCDDNKLQYLSKNYSNNYFDKTALIFIIITSVLILFTLLYIFALKKYFKKRF
jgi:hypothetical protein